MEAFLLNEYGKDLDFCEVLARVYIGWKSESTDKMIAITANKMVIVGLLFNSTKQAQ